MKRRRFWWSRMLFRLLPALAVLALTTSVCAATFAVLPSTDDLVIGARAIVNGRVVSLSSHFDAESGSVFTYITVQIERVWKGQIASQRIVLRELGGIAGTHGTRYSAAPVFNVDEQALLFLDTWSDGSLRVHQGFLGKLNAAAIENLGDKVTTNARASFLHEKRYYTGTMLVFPPDYLPVAQGQAQPNFTFLIPSIPIRWFQVDQGQPVSYTINTSAPVGGMLPANATPAEIIADAQTAMNAFSAQGGTALRLIGAGATDGPCGLRAGDGNGISFNNCDGIFSPSAGCSGLLAVALVQYVVGNSGVVNGVTFYQIIEGDLSFNPAAACILTDHCRIQEVMTHELGHTVGLGHSDDLTATMAAFAHFDGRCATLQGDDVSGVRFIYPPLSGPVPTPTPTVTPTPPPTPSPEPTATPAATPTPHATPSPLPTATPVATPTATPTPTPAPSPREGPIVASPHPAQSCDGSGLASVTLTWNAPNAFSVQIRRDSPTVGDLVLLVGRPSGVITVGEVRDGTRFYLINRHTRAVIGSVVVSVTSDGCFISAVINTGLR